jgi:hypothetical protein
MRLRILASLVLIPLATATFASHVARAQDGSGSDEELDVYAEINIDPGTGDIDAYAEADTEGDSYLVGLSLNVTDNGSDSTIGWNYAEIWMTGQVDALGKDYTASASADATPYIGWLPALSASCSPTLSVPNWPSIQLTSIDTSTPDVAQFNVAINPADALYSLSFGLLLPDGSPLGGYGILTDPTSSVEFTASPSSFPNLVALDITYAPGMYGMSFDGSFGSIYTQNGISSSNTGGRLQVVGFKYFQIPVIVFFSHTVADVSTSYVYSPPASGCNTLVTSGSATVQSGSPSSAEIGGIAETFSLSDSAGHSYTAQAGTLNQGSSVSVSTAWGNAWLYPNGTGTMCNTDILIVTNAGVVPGSVGCLTVSLP